LLYFTCFLFVFNKRVFFRLSIAKMQSIHVIWSVKIINSTKIDSVYYPSRYMRELIVPLSWTVAESEFQSHWTSGRGFVHRGQRLLLSSRPPQKQSLLSAIRTNMVRIYIDTVYDEIFRDWIASLSLSFEPSPFLFLLFF